MNVLRSAMYLVAALSWSAMLITFAIGSFYPNNFTIGFAMSLSIVLFLTWFVKYFREAVNFND